jgi:hypothetical protein
MTCDWTHQYNLTLRTLHACLHKLKRRAINVVQLVEVINIAMLAMVAYPTCVATFSETELQKIDDIITKTVVAKLKLQDNHHFDHLHLNATQGGFSLESIASLHDAYKLNALYLALNGRPSPIQRFLIMFSRCHATDAKSIQIQTDSVWTPVLNMLKDRKMGIHTTDEYYKPVLTNASPHDKNHPPRPPRKVWTTLHTVAI